MKKCIQLMLVTVLFFSSFLIYAPNKMVAQVQDDLTGHSLEAEMREAVNRGILKGYGPGRFGPDDRVNRAQFATFVARALSLPNGVSNFEDVPQSHPLAQGIGRTAASGIVAGYPNGSFYPERNITREQMAAMISRALEYEGMSLTPAALTFTDVEQIHPNFREAVANNTYLGIIHGIPTSTQRLRFGPKDDATRAQAAAFIVRMLQVLESGDSLNDLYKTGTIVNGQVRLDTQAYLTYQQAATTGKDLIYQGQNLMKMKNGLVVANPPAGQEIVRIMNAAKTSQLTYVVKGTELQYINADENWVHVRYADGEGYIRQSEAWLLPTELQKGRAQYTVTNGVLHYRGFDHLKGEYEWARPYSDAPSFMQNGQVYYSLNGYDFFNVSGQKVGTAYQYFNFLPLRTKTNYTAEDLNRYIASVNQTINGKNVATDSPLLNLGHVFIEAQEKYGINALYLFGKAIHESSYGLSVIAEQRKNLFGYGAYDSDPLGNAKPFNSFEESIHHVANSMNNRYLTPGGDQYRGAVLGLKGHGMNVNYASDPLWGQKIASHMYRADNFLGKKDYGYYTIAKTTTAGLNVRSDASTSSTAQFQFPQAGHYVAYVPGRNQAVATWYQIFSDHKDHQYGYVHGSYIEPINIMKR
ncbi:S-layer homology domain-containing protein [Alkalihalophilus marmarensis]|uniref:S-layer homology domain-containing protein n=1 Tax=Alkalihalophilus marmarensis TaxID=521377 RepID=UPI00203D3E48|nr:S-layer homology domain-containing protein [Alkalihalophilus marmarensis]MCM3489961.1 S-layer homology domain-containing protein [Alkalihalophilus marmarensis]